MKVEAPSLSALPGIRHGFFTRRGGVSQGLYHSLNGGLGSKDDPANVLENRARMAREIGVAPEALVACWQVHSPEAVILTTPWTREDAPQADAVVTAVPGLGATITVADCGPVLFADPDARVVGAAHAGWKGAFGGVLESTLRRMEELGAKRGNIRAAIGPLIRQPSYEVGADFIARFIDEDRTFARFFIAAEREGHALFDLPGFIAHRLAQAGVGAVEDLKLDTYADPERFFSYRRSTHRREADYGRMVAAIALI
ncbi:peptidoglycan editing factor PgeF [Xanthobacter sp. VNH20]|uniref:peptidoglycan editing factor PgeF n=1 Tax=Xanthobacter sp. VNH20 TaxID=3156616 RepID=UPI0032B3B794